MVPGDRFWQTYPRMQMPQKREPNPQFGSFDPQNVPVPSDHPPARGSASPNAGGSATLEIAFRRARSRPATVIGKERSLHRFLTSQTPAGAHHARPLGVRYLNTMRERHYRHTFRVQNDPVHAGESIFNRITCSLLYPSGDVLSTG